MHQQKYSGIYLIQFTTFEQSRDHEINSSHVIIALLLFITIMGGLHQPHRHNNQT
jgi:hypothetical protein